MKSRLLGAVVVCATAATVLGACATGANASAPQVTPAAATSSTASLSGSVTVFAAASLQETFTTLKKQFEAAHPGIAVTPSFGASSALAQQINQGAPADVFASASQTNMDQVIQAGAAATSRPFAKNVMEIAVPPSNPASIASVNDLGKRGVKLVLCQPQVPCGSVAARVFANAKITVTPVSEEADVKAVLTKVQLGEADAGVVYVTDVRAAGDKVKGVEIPSDVNASTSYPLAALSKAPNPDAAAAFVAYVLSSEGQQELRAGGFAAP